MSLTPDERRWMDRREELTEDEGNFVRIVLEDARDAAKCCDVRLANDDRAAHFEAAAIRYAIESRRPRP
jgi:hypothetical protein